jgi:hypothetical protein
MDALASSIASSASNEDAIEAERLKIMKMLGLTSNIAGGLPFYFRCPLALSA